jgi:hypothetical protein
VPVWKIGAVFSLRPSRTAAAGRSRCTALGLPTATRFRSLADSSHPTVGPFHRAAAGLHRAAGSSRRVAEASRRLVGAFHRAVKSSHHVVERRHRLVESSHREVESSHHTVGSFHHEGEATPQAAVRQRITLEQTVRDTPRFDFTTHPSTTRSQPHKTYA